MKKNLFKEKLGRGEVTTGVVVVEPGIQTVEILGLLGFDWLFIDCEHSVMSLESVSQIVLAAERREVTPVVRVPQNVAEVILRYMDMGVMGVIIPEVSSPEDAERAVHAVKYPPDGERGLAGVRAADYGLRGPLGEYTKTANLETMVLADIEDPRGVDKAGEILAVRGIDGAIFGANDLSKSLGVAGETSHPLVLAAADKVLAAGIRTGKPIGAIVRGSETPRQYMEKGYRMVVASVPGLLVSAGKQFLAGVRG